MSETKDGTQSSRWLAPPIQIAATALAGITAAFVGSMLGVYGTVLGAGLASGITTVGASLYERSQERTKNKVREGAEKVPINRARRRNVAAAQQTRVISPVGNGTGNAVDPPTRKLRPVGDAAGSGPAAGPVGGHRLRWLLIIGTAVAGFLITMLAVTGIETISGQALSGGQGTSVGSFFQRQPADGNSPQQQPQPREQPSGEQQAPPQQDQQDHGPQHQKQSQDHPQQPQQQSTPQPGPEGKQDQGPQRQQQPPRQGEQNQQEQQPQQDGPAGEDGGPQQDSPQQQQQQEQAPQQRGVPGGTSSD